MAPPGTPPAGGAAPEGRTDPAAVFHDLLERDRERWLGTVEETRRALMDAECHYGGREMVKALRPKFLGSGDYAYLDYVCGVIMAAFRRLNVLALDDPDVLDFLGVTEAERTLLEPEPLCPDPNALVRLDTFLTPDGPRFVELNGEAPAGPGYCDQSYVVLSRHPLVQETVQRTSAYPVSTREGLLRGLMMGWRAAGRSGSPTILITDYLDVPTVGEFYLIADYLRSAGFETIVEDVRALGYQGGRLVADGRPVDLVYRRVLTGEFLQRFDEVQALWGAYRDGAVVMLDPFRGKIAHKKAAFALLTGDHVDPTWLTPEERRVIGRHVPWTRRVRETRTVHGDREVDLLPHLAANHERFVLKPNDDYGGRGIHIGWEMDEAEFSAALEDAARGDYVAQERVRTVEELFPLLSRSLEEQPMIVDLDPYVYFGRMHGILARLGAGSLCNVTSGGGQVPVLLYPDP